MKNENMTIQEIEEAINKRMGIFAGRKYEGTKFHSWYAAEIAEELKACGITELSPCTWGIRADVSENGVSFYDRIAEMKIEFKRDKRYTVNTRGIIICITPKFREELLPLTLSEARRYLLEETKQKWIARTVELRDKAREEAEKAEAERVRLSALTF